MAKSEEKALKKGGGTLQVQIVQIMTDKAAPNELWTVDDMIGETGLEKRQVDNAMSNAWKSGKIFRHKDNLKEGQGWGVAQYALKMKDADKKSPVAQVSPGGKLPGKRRGSMPTAKEIRMDFLEIQRLMARLEDKVMTVAERSEEMDKQLNKLKNIL